MNPGQDYSNEDQRVQVLFDFALNREDIKWLLGRLPREAKVDPNTMEYELQLLKIISVGWAISYFLPKEESKHGILESYWEAIRNFSQDLSKTTNLLIGQNVDYFEILKSRLELYVQAMGKLESNAAPIQAIGPEFARTCGDENNPFMSLVGAKMFASCLANVRAVSQNEQVEYNRGGLSFTGASS